MESLEQDGVPIAVHCLVPLVILLCCLHVKHVVSGLESMMVLIETFWQRIPLTFILTFLQSFPVLLSLRNGIAARLWLRQWPSGLFRKVSPLPIMIISNSSDMQR